MMPIRGNADRGIVEVRTRERIKRPSQPVAEEDGAKRDPLIASRPEGQQEKKGIAEADLGERVFKGEVGLGVVELSGERCRARSAERSARWCGPASWEIQRLSVAGC